MRFSILIFAIYSIIQGNIGGRQKIRARSATIPASSSQQVPQTGYLYPIPAEANIARVQLNFPPLALPRPSSTAEQLNLQQLERLPSASVQEPAVEQADSTENEEVIVSENAKTFEVEDVSDEDEYDDETTTESDVTTTAIVPSLRSSEAEHANIEAIDVACGKEKMTVRVTFDSVFNGIIYAKGYYADPKCRFVQENSGQDVYMFELTTGECGVTFIDDGLSEGGQAFVETLLVVIFEPGVQEAWDASRKIRCLWEGNLEQTVTFPLSVNMLDQKLLTFSGDTASVALEIQAGDGPRATPVQGLVRIGDILTAVITVQGDSAFDLHVRNCVATDGTTSNRIQLSDMRGCATKPKLMGGWTKEKSSGGVLAFAKLSAFKFPDVMDLFVECSVSLCKGNCDECPDTEYLELLVPANDEEIKEDSTTINSGSITSTTTTTTTSTLAPPSSSSIVPLTSNNITETVASASNRFELRAPSARIHHQPRSKRRHNSRPRRHVSNGSLHSSGSEGIPKRAHYRSQSRSPVLESESLKLRRVVHVVGPDDFPDFGYGSSSSPSAAASSSVSSPSTTSFLGSIPIIYGSSEGSTICPRVSSECYSLVGLVAVGSISIFLILISVAIIGTIRRRNEYKY